MDELRKKYGKGTITAKTMKSALNMKTKERISEKIIKSTLKSSGLSYRNWAQPYQYKKNITGAPYKMQACAKELINFIKNGKNQIFLDEKKHPQHKHKRFTYSNNNGENLFGEKLKSLPKVKPEVIAAYDKNGLRGLQIIESCTTKKCITIFFDELVENCPKLQTGEELVVLDNASWHSDKRLGKMYKKNTPWYFLSPYSPALNYIELIFRSSEDNFTNLNDFNENNIIENIFKSYLINSKILKNYYFFYVKNLLSYI